MKHLVTIILLVLFSETIHAQYRAAEIIMNDGSKREGFAKTPDFSNKNVSFKVGETDKAQSIKSKDIKTIIFTDGAEPREMNYLNCLMKETIISAAGWGWLTLVSRGVVSTYKGKKPPVTGQRYLNNDDVVYYHREGEKYANVPTILTFAATMAKYFEDYPELSAKIKNKTDGYKYENMEAIVAEYNDWKRN